MMALLVLVPPSRSRAITGSCIAMDFGSSVIVVDAWEIALCRSRLPTEVNVPDCVALFAQISDADGDITRGEMTFGNVIPRTELTPLISSALSALVRNGSHTSEDSKRSRNEQLGQHRSSHHVARAQVRLRVGR